MNMKTILSGGMVLSGMLYAAAADAMVSYDALPKIVHEPGKSTYAAALGTAGDRAAFEGDLRAKANRIINALGVTEEYFKTSYLPEGIDTVEEFVYEVTTTSNGRCRVDVGNERQMERVLLAMKLQAAHDWLGSQKSNSRNNQRKKSMEHLKALREAEMPVLDAILKLDVRTEPTNGDLSAVLQSKADAVSGIIGSVKTLMKTVKSISEDSGQNFGKAEKFRENLRLNKELHIKELEALIRVCSLIVNDIPQMLNLYGNLKGFNVATVRAVSDFYVKMVYGAILTYGFSVGRVSVGAAYMSINGHGILGSLPAKLQIDIYKRLDDLLPVMSDLGMGLDDIRIQLSDGIVVDEDHVRLPDDWKPAAENPNMIPLPPAVQNALNARS
ncbi:MAG: hypothetical protein LBO73_02465 [Holosporaceae bacterium]|jgi:hypothetical protein|nr:hypothetical protein [Holosporaceae bacterium]